jgi:hypothetical protein
MVFEEELIDAIIESPSNVLVVDRGQASQEEASRLHKAYRRDDKR